ncbi:hypothetical protein FUAX_11960 [Fulvitalea axinellae]|uniref:Uncharacterized protein n=1 Tax=Fulvitalea axinellae TaxID=1182444 RepID=A0AAU9D313_9BACT|nr:hypothetical protein FUAX_11960 [Fulvitalea axinellae]
MNRKMTIKLSATRLKSGKYQVKFRATSLDQELCYGYLLADDHATEDEVLADVKVGVRRAIEGDMYQHGQLYRLGRRLPLSDRLLVYKNVLA